MKGKYYDMDFRNGWWIHPLVIHKSNMQDMRIRYKSEGYHDSLMSDDKLR